MPRLPLAFFRRDAATVARALLGCVLHVRTRRDIQRVRVVETEAYVGVHDLACHAARGRTARTETMFAAGGIAYVYLVYGMHDMFNVVTGAEGAGEAVLIRAAEDIARPLPSPRLLAGPGRLTRALGLDRSDNGIRLTGPRLWFAHGPAPIRIAATPRIGVDYAGPWRLAPLRFFDADSPALSRPVRQPTRSKAAR